MNRPGDAPSPGAVVRGRSTWHIADRLGTGGAGSVYLAYRPDGEPNTAAVKIIAKDADRARLKRELSSMLAVKHPRIPEVYDWSVDGEWPFVAMAYYPNGSLSDMLRKGPLPEPDLWRVLTDVLAALVAAHAASLVHLDVKPANVLVDEERRFGLADFGVAQGARSTGKELKTVGLGTPGYRSPEQRTMQRHRFDMRTDLYSLGTTLWSACTGIDLASRKARAVLQRTDLAGPYGVPHLAEFRPYLDPALRALVMSLTTRDADARPGSAAEVLSYVEAQLEGSPQAQSWGGTEVSETKAEEIYGRLMDPLWAFTFREGGRRGVYRLEDGDYLCRQGERSYTAFILLHGKLRVTVGGREIAIEDREGTLLGEVATLTGGERSASLQAVGTVFVRVLNASQLEGIVSANPAVGMRLVRAMATRLARS